MSSDYLQLPADLPRPQDDGAADHLPGTRLPALALPATDGRLIDLSQLPGLVVVYAYPMTGRPGVALPEGWDAMPGARGCTPQSCAYRDHYPQFIDAGVSLFGLSVQDSGYQQELVQRLHLPFAVLSDNALALATALRKPVCHTCPASSAPAYSPILRKPDISVLGNVQIARRELRLNSARHRQR